MKTTTNRWSWKITLAIGIVQLSCAVVLAQTSRTVAGRRQSQVHRVDRVTVFSPSAWELSFPKRPGMPDHGHTVSRTELDTLLLKHAESAGAEAVMKEMSSK